MAHRGSGRNRLPGTAQRIALLEQPPGGRRKADSRGPPYRVTSPAPVFEYRSRKAPRSAAGTSNEAIGHNEDDDEDEIWGEIDDCGEDVGMAVSAGDSHYDVIWATTNPIRGAVF
jgi:hypothetical protein